MDLAEVVVSGARLTPARPASPDAPCRRVEPVRQGCRLRRLQNAERGLMPILEDEAANYGYIAKDR